jgi:hypothetical protein
MNEKADRAGDLRCRPERFRNAEVGSSSLLPSTKLPLPIHAEVAHRSFSGGSHFHQPNPTVSNGPTERVRRYNE